MSLLTFGKNDIAAMGRGIIWLVLCSVALRAEGKMCEAYLPVYGAAGDLLPSRVTGVFATNNPKAANLLFERRIKITVRGNKLDFPAEAVDRSIFIDIELVGRRYVIERSILFLGACQMLRSYQIGILNAGIGDSSSESVSGRLIGCTDYTGWWIRAVPMFGELKNELFEGRVLTDGRFIVFGNTDGRRFALMIGKGKEIIKSIGVNIVAVGVNKTGDIDVSGLCPRQ